MQISAVLPGHIVGTADVFRKRREGRKEPKILERKELRKKLTLFTKYFNVHHLY